MLTINLVPVRVRGDAQNGEPDTHLFFLRLSGNDELSQKFANDNKLSGADEFLIKRNEEDAKTKAHEIEICAKEAGLETFVIKLEECAI